MKEGGGYQDPTQVAREKVKRILEHHHTEPLEEAQQAELKHILQTADHELG